MRGGGGKGFTSVLLSAFQNYGVGFYRKMTSGRPVSLKYNKDEKYYNSFMFSLPGYFFYDGRINYLRETSILANHQRWRQELFLANHIWN